MLEPKAKHDGTFVRERILGFGPPESGKTSAFLSMAKWYADTGTKGHFYVVNTDLSYEALLFDPDYEDLDNITVYHCDPSNMQEIIDAGDEIKKKGTFSDWMSVDLTADCWRAAQDEYANLSTKGKIANVGTLWRTTGNPDAYPITGWEWGMPNARYRYLMNNCVRSFPGHVYCVAGQKELLQTSGSGKTSENELVRTTFSHIGLKPDTKADEEVYRFHTILLFGGNRTRGFKLTTAKERFKGRRLMGKEMNNGMRKGEAMEDFVLDYLVGVAGWTM